MSGLGSRILATWDRFLFESCTPQMIPWIRMSYAVLISIQTIVWMVDAEQWFTDAGVMQTATAFRIAGHAKWSLLSVLPSNLPTVQICLALLLLHSVMLFLGVWSRLQAAMIFVWLVSFQSRCPLIADGEDTVFRLFAFFMIWMPLDIAWSLGSRTTSPRVTLETKRESWALRLMQMQMTAIYVSTAWNKWQGPTWQDGTAMYYVSRMTDNYGRLVPSDWFDQYWISALATWSALAIETLLPVGLWIHSTRKTAILLGIALHMGIEMSMNLFLFEWIMIVGLLSFVVPSEWKSTHQPLMS